MKRIKPLSLTLLSKTPEARRVEKFYVVARRVKGKYLFVGRGETPYWTDDIFKAEWIPEKQKRAFSPYGPPHPDDLKRVCVFCHPQLPRDTPLLILEVERVIEDKVWLVEPDEFKGEGI